MYLHRHTSNVWLMGGEKNWISIVAVHSAEMGADLEGENLGQRSTVRGGQPSGFLPAQS